MIPVAVALLASAAAAPQGAPDTALPWYRQVEVSVGMGAAANSHSDRARGVARLGAGWRWHERVGIELVTTASPDLVAVTPGLTFRPVIGPVEAVVSAGFGVGATGEIDGCGGPLDGRKGCGWADQYGAFEEVYIKSVTRGTVGARFDVDRLWVSPQIDAQLMDLDPTIGWELGLTVSVGLEHEQDEAPQWVVRTRERLQRQRLERVRRDFYSENRDVAVEAWHVVMDEYRRQAPGFRREIYESYVVEALETGLFSQREAAEVYRKHGESLEVLRPALSARPMDCAAAGHTIRVIAQRTGQEREAVELLGAAAVEGATCDLEPVERELGQRY